jgi:hypothetical protein
VAHQANATRNAIAPGDDPGSRAARVATGGVSVAAGRKGFKAGLDDVRERMRSLGLGYDEIAAEVARRHRLRPRESYRLAWGWTLGHAAERLNALAAQQGTDPQARASMTGPHVCEHERWPDSGRKPSVYVLLTLARMYQTDVLRLLDLADHECLAPEDRLALVRPSQPRAVGSPGGSLVTVAGDRDEADAPVLSLSLPYVPGRLVIEISDLAADAGRASGPPPGGQLALVRDLPGHGRQDSSR